MDLQVAGYQRTTTGMTLPARSPFRRRGESAKEEATLQPGDRSAVGVQFRRFSDIVDEPITGGAEKQGEW